MCVTFSGLVMDERGRPDWSGLEPYPVTVGVRLVRSETPVWAAVRRLPGCAPAVFRTLIQMTVLESVSW